jgi:hypothetical protein
VGRVRLDLHLEGPLGLCASRTDRLVLVRVGRGRPLLLVTPGGDERFAAGLGAISRA